MMSQSSIEKACPRGKKNKTKHELARSFSQGRQKHTFWKNTVKRDEHKNDNLDEINSHQNY